MVAILQSSCSAAITLTLSRAASAGMVLLNKAALSSFSFESPTSLLFFQCALCVVLVRASAVLGFIRLEPFNLEIVKLWFPVNLIFVGMIWTSFFALKSLGVPMATVLKNLTNLFTIGGDYFLYKKTYSAPVCALILRFQSRFLVYSFAWAVSAPLTKKFCVPLKANHQL